jgi:hypothetical protein
MKKLLIFILFYSINLTAATDVSDRISSSETWMTTGDSNYRIIRDLTNETGTTLIIKPGVKVGYVGACLSYFSQLNIEYNWYHI